MSAWDPGGDGDQGAILAVEKRTNNYVKSIKAW